MAAQQSFSTEIARLVTQKQTAYTAALSLTGSLRLDAIWAMNTQFRKGLITAIKTLNAVKKSNKSHFSGVKECKKEIKKEKKEDRREDKEEKKEENREDREDIKEKKEEIKSQIKSLKDRIKELKQSQENGSSHR